MMTLATTKYPWGKVPPVTVSELFALSPDINAIAQRLAHKRYQTLKANHYRVQDKKKD